MLRPLLAPAVLVGALVAADVPAPVPASVLVLGDSYAAGVGAPGAEATCGRDDEAAPGVLVAEALGASVSSRACAGAQVEDVLGPGGQLEGAPQADLVLLGVGGNDLGFLEVVTACLGLDAPPGADVDGASWTDTVTSGVVHGGCGLDRPTLDARIEGLVAGDDTTPGLAELYARVATTVVAEGGTLVVVGYPSLWAPSERWPARYGVRCHGLRAADAGVLVDVAAALDAALAAAVTAARSSVEGRAVRYVSVAAAYAGTPGADHRLCGGGEPWMNGRTLVEGGVDLVPLLGGLQRGDPPATLLGGLGTPAALHPTVAGHAATAALVLEALELG